MATPPIWLMRASSARRTRAAGAGGSLTSGRATGAATDRICPAGRSRRRPTCQDFHGRDSPSSPRRWRSDGGGQDRFATFLPVRRPRVCQSSGCQSRDVTTGAQDTRRRRSGLVPLQEVADSFADSASAGVGASRDIRPGHARVSSGGTTRPSLQTFCGIPDLVAQVHGELLRSVSVYPAFDRR